MRDTGLASTAVALAESTEHVHRFFEQLRTELAFYIGCLNLHSALTAKGEPFCFPGPPAVGSPTLEARGLYDPALSLRIDGRAIGNDVAGDGKALLVITGANGGGKSTLLRAIGTAQLMMQAGMFVAADAYRADVRDAVLTHFRREEDPTLERGKLDEELARMSEIVDHVSGRSLVLLNESLSATNEREGSQIAREIVRALLERGVKVAYVTHLYDLAETFHRLGMPDALFLRAERGTDGDRPFLLTEAPPLPTSFGRDVYGRVFGVDAPGTPETADAGEAA
jgi:DNA mismatch repair ATPase MutS